MIRHLNPIFKATLLILVLATYNAPADTVVYQNGSSNAFVTNYNGAQGTTISSNNPTFNYGKYGGYTSTYGNEGLLRFDLSSLTGSFSLVDSASITFNWGTFFPNNGVTSGTIDAYAILPADSGWVQGTAQGAAQSGSANWNYAQSGTLAWAGSPGLGTPGTDYSPTLLGSFTFNSSSGGPYTLNLTGLNPSQLTSLISSWTTSTNAGILLVDPNSTDASAIFIGTSPSSPMFFDQESPKLTLDYETVPEPSSWALLILGLAGLALWHFGKSRASI